MVLCAASVHGSKLLHSRDTSRHTIHRWQRCLQRFDLLEYKMIKPIQRSSTYWENHLTSTWQRCHPQEQPPWNYWFEY